MRLPESLQISFIDASAADVERDIADLAEGLAAPVASIPPRFFYDALGSSLFAAICELPEYYPTRTERAILQRQAGAIAGCAGTGRVVVDLGAGDCRKAELLLPALAPRGYVAVDVSVAFLRESLQRLQRAHPDVAMTGLATDFSRGLSLPAQMPPGPRLLFYPGSSIGNFAPAQALTFLRSLRRAAGDDGALLIGIDLVKDSATLTAAYDDALGVTAAFNRNVLNGVNRVIGSDFRIADWQHLARYDERAARIEMWLVARGDVTVRWRGGQRRFAAGERLLTEYSHKYRIDDFVATLTSAGFGPARVFTDGQARFAVICAPAAAAAG